MSDIIIELGSEPIINLNEATNSPSIKSNQSQDSSASPLRQSIEIQKYCDGCSVPGRFEQKSLFKCQNCRPECVVGCGAKANFNTNDSYLCTRCFKNPDRPALIGNPETTLCAALIEKYNKYKNRKSTEEKSKRKENLKQYQFKIEQKKAFEYFQDNCFYCGAQPILKISNTNPKIILNGIDRLNHKKKYIPSNIVTCCKTCNYAKHTLSKAKFIKLCKKITQYQASQESPRNS